MNVLNNYIKAVEDLSSYFGTDLREYTVEVNDGFFTIIEDDNEVCWAETIEELGDDNGDYYIAEIITVKTTEELALFFVENVYGGNAYYIIFKNKNRVEIE